MNTDPAISVTALTVVKRVISFLSRSKKIGRQLASSAPRLSPRLQIICPLWEKTCIVVIVMYYDDLAILERDTIAF
jgi:hypothetical protein